jgi:RES domain-containing protein
VIAGFYLADSPDTAWAEWSRHLAELGLRPERQLPRDLWRLRVDVRRIANLSDRRQLSEVGLPPPRPTRREWPAFQGVGERLHTERWRGIVAPSAARTDGRILCLFREEETIQGVRPVPPPAIYRKPPVPPADT